MNVWWSATSPSSGRFAAPEVETDMAELVERFEWLRAQGRGYLEVRRDDDFPVLTMGFQDGVAVVHLFTSAETTCLLLGESAADAESTQVPVMDEPAEFTAEFVHRLDHAWEAVQQFVRTGEVTGLGQWYEL
ncbi:hypothetical protein [Actinoallomurus sp. CA-142502]|uniref:hypothetical protein n=1 Tax=Actinoallomurus sp. CA-142502 TaxID=3239885 RepID=UPI003D918EA8